MEFNLNQDLLNLEVWSKKRLLSFNPSKTEAVYCNNKRNAVIPTLKFQGCNLEFVTTHKHSGVIFSEDFSFSSYMNSISANAQKKLGLIKKTLI